ncbi:hypothetical protein ACWKSP_28250 [Micromonosporaceae bacterium Da 78-11]
MLCAYLRMPYTPPPDATPLPAPPDTMPVGLSLGRPKRGDDGPDARQEQQVRHTVLALICEHLQPAGTDDRPRWHAHRFDLRGAVLDGGSLRGIQVTAGTALDLTDATFPSGTVDFGGAVISGGTVSSVGAVMSGGTVTSVGARFSGGAVALSFPRVWSMPPVGMDGSEPGVSWPSPGHLAKIVSKSR